MAFRYRVMRHQIAVGGEIVEPREPPPEWKCYPIPKGLPLKPSLCENDLTEPPFDKTYLQVTPIVTRLGIGANALWQGATWQSSVKLFFLIGFTRFDTEFFFGILQTRCEKASNCVSPVLIQG